MIEQIAQVAMELSAAQFSTAYATSVTKLGMEAQELALNTILDMMPAPALPKGKYIDTYA